MEEEYSENTKEQVRTNNDNSNSGAKHRASETKTTGQSQQNSDKFWKITTIVLIVVLAVFAFKGGNFTGGTVLNDGAAPSPSPSPTPTPVIDMTGLVTNDDHVKGDKDAPVTIVEWSDFECPFCARFYTETLSQIDEQYIKTGKAKLVYKDFPLSFHPNAQKAAEAAECAGEQGKYWEMHDVLFEKGVSGGVTGFKTYAKEMGLDTNDFDSCLDSGKTAQEIQADMALGGRSGIQGTPGFIVNGQLVSGAQPFTVFQQVIEAVLNS